MALSISTARAAVKTRLDISTTTFDAQVDEFVLTAVGRLWPKLAIEVASQDKSVTPDSFGEVTVDLSLLTTPVTAARMVEATTGDGRYFQVIDTYQHGTKLRLRDLPSNTTGVRIYGLNACTLTTVPDNFFLPVYWYAISEFYDYLQGNKRKYNLYVSGGGRAVDNMADESEAFAQKADDYVEEHRTVY